jgi:DNA-binding LacI/PurR family transcriptional regulator
MGQGSGSHGRRPTLRDVAALAGVSKSLASLALRGEPMVREEKRRRVYEAAEELGYQASARSPSAPAARSTRLVGVLVSDLHNPLLIDVAERAGEVLADAGFTMVLIRAGRLTPPSFGGRPAVPAIDVLNDTLAKGLLVVGSVPRPANLAYVADRFPVVIAAAHADGVRADVVRNDDHLGMRLVVDYLVACGHRAIAHLGGLGGGTAKERLAGYRAGMQNHGLESGIALADSDFTEDAGYRGTAQLLRRGWSVTAITAVNDLAAVGALSAAADAGLRVPADLAVTGYDDTVIAAMRQVSLTSINPDSAGIGALAAHRLLRRIDAPQLEPEEHLLPPRLITRLSTVTPR